MNKKIPRTKDGKHELVFNKCLVHGGSYNARTPVCGRLGYEILRLAENDPELIARLNEEYDSVFRYDIAGDPANLFSQITIPIIGSPDLESAVYDGKELVVSEFTAPYTPFNKIWGVIPGFYDGDLRNAYLGAKAIGSISEQEREEITAASRKPTQEKVEGKFETRSIYNLDDLFNPDWREIMKKWSRICSQKVKYCVKGQIKDLKTGNPLYQERGSKFRLSEQKALELYDAIIALCDEYLVEMRE